MYPGTPYDMPDDEREELAALDEQAEAEAREQAFGEYRASGPRALGDLDLRAAAQHAQLIGDHAAERQIDGVLAVREARR